MASASAGEDGKSDERRNQVMLGDLPSDFLRVTPITEEQQVALDEQAALALQQQLSGNFAPANVSGRLSISVIEAKLTKNYGMTRMDPYVRLRIGHTVYETHTDYNGAKNPRWNKIFHCFLFPSITSIHVDIFDECSFTLDEKVAWTQYTIPEAVFNGETLDEWVPLCGRQGEGKEGSINLVLSYTGNASSTALMDASPLTIPAGTVVYPAQSMVAVVPSPYYGVMPTMPYCSPVYSQCAGQNPGVPVQQGPVQQGAVQQPTPITDEDIQLVKEMFPNIEDDVIRTVMESNRGNKDHTINALLTLSAES